MSLLFIIIFCVAILFSMLGLGGGVFYVPLLLQAGLPFREAAATSLSIILVMSLTATFFFHKNRLVDWKLVLLLEPFSIIGAYTAGLSSDFFEVSLLEGLFGLVALISAFFMIKPAVPKAFKKINKAGFIHRRMGSEEYHINLWAGIPLSFIAGYGSVLLGIGGGFAKVPMMALIFGVPSKIAVATSSAMIVITSLTGFSGYALTGHVNYELSLVLAVAVFFGGYVGSRISVKTEKRFINMLFGILLIIVSGWMLYRAFL